MLKQQILTLFLQTPCNSRKEAKKRKRKVNLPFVFNLAKDLAALRTPADFLIRSRLKTKISKCKTKTNLDHVLNLVSALNLNALQTTINIEDQSVLSVVVDDTKKCVQKEKS